MRWIVQATAAATVLLVTAAEASLLTPPVLPLIVRNPYLSTWLQNAREPPWSRWPMFWTGTELLFLNQTRSSHYSEDLRIRYYRSTSKMGNYNLSYPTYVGAKFDASVTNLTYLIPNPAGKQTVEIILSFLSPITPTSTLRQSIPASYLTVTVTGGFDVDIYIDVNGQWVSADRGSRINWELAHTDMGEGKKGLKTWKVRRETEQLLTENRDQAEWGTLHFTAPSDVRHECGTSALLRQRFSRTGTLQDAVDDEFRSIMDEEPVFAFSKSFKLSSGSSSSSPKTDSVLFTIAHIQDPVVQYASARGLTFMKPLWQSWFFSTEALLMFHYLDFSSASILAGNYSEQLAKDAYESGSDNYVDIVALSARQTMGATSFSGTPDNPILFLKEISSNGNFQTIDVIYPAFPFFLYTNPRWLAYLLEPLIEHMLSGQYPNQYAMHDLGYHFPNATGHSDGNDEYMPVEECGDILIMGLAIINSLKYDTEEAAGSLWSIQGSSDFETESDASAFALAAPEMRDGIYGLDNQWGGEIKGNKQAQKWVGKSYKLWKQWTGYLVDYTLTPHNQLSTDDFAGWLANQTNLAIKGIIGIKAMSEISELIGNTEDAKYYRNISKVYIGKWEEYGMSRDGRYAKLAYQWYGSWTTLYNIYADSLLCFHLPSTSSAKTSTSIPTLLDNDQKPIKPGKPGKHDDEDGFVPKRIYKATSDWYLNVMQKYGLPLDSRHLYTKSDWEFFAAAVTSEKVREEILDSTALWVNETSTDRPFTDLYKTEEDGGFPGPNFFARPVIGGHFAFLTLGRACGGKAVEGLAFLNE